MPERLVDQLELGRLERLVEQRREQRLVEQRREREQRLELVLRFVRRIQLFVRCIRLVVVIVVGLAPVRRGRRSRLTADGMLAVCAGGPSVSWRSAF